MCCPSRVRGNEYLRQQHDRIVPAEIMGDPYSRYDSQAYDDGRWTENGPIEADEEGPKVPVAAGRDDFRLVHDSAW